MKLTHFLQELQEATAEDVVVLALEHMLKKVFDCEAEYSKGEFLEFLANYNNYIKYLNDFMSVICKKYNTDVDSIYFYACEIFEIEADNKSLFDFRLKRLLFNTPQRVLSIISHDIKEHNLEHMIEELAILKESTFYKNHFENYQPEMQIIQDNIEVIQKAINQD